MLWVTHNGYKTNGNFARSWKQIFAESYHMKSSRVEKLSRKQCLSVWELCVITYSTLINHMRTKI